jgi:membrane protein insertase Oxa1/YidC/SpoIIIJ
LEKKGEFTHRGAGTGSPLFILPILAGVTQWIQSRMMPTQNIDPQQRKRMNTITNLTPLIVFFASRYASGLSWYWATSTVIGIVWWRRLGFFVPQIP